MQIEPLDTAVLVKNPLKAKLEIWPVGKTWLAGNSLELYNLFGCLRH